MTTFIVNHKELMPIAFDDSTFGGPGQDLTNEQNDMYLDWCPEHSRVGDLMGYI
jgi:hypothetical protein